MYNKEKIVNNLCNRNYHGTDNTVKAYLRVWIDF